MSDSLDELLVRMKHFDPTQLHRVLLSVQEQLDEQRRSDRQSQSRPGAGPGPTPPKPSFDELEAWFRARRSRARADDERLSELLGDDQGGGPLDGQPDGHVPGEEPRPPLVVPMGLDGPRGGGAIELVNETGRSVVVQLVAGHGAVREGTPVAVELLVQEGSPTLGPGEARVVRLGLQIEPADAAATTVVPVEARGDGEVLARFWLEVAAGHSKAAQGDRRVYLRRDLGPQLRVLSRLRRAILMHPEGSRALYGALIAEGRRFAKTSAGRTWSDRLARSEKMRRLRLAWEVLSLSTLDGAEESEALPSAWMDALYALAGRSDMEESLAGLSRAARGE